MSRPEWAVRLTEARTRRLWTQHDLAARLREAADPAARLRLPRDDINIVRRIMAWEAGRNQPGDRYTVLYERVFGVPWATLTGDSSAASPTSTPVPESLPAVDPATAARLSRLTPALVDEVLDHLREQWHQLVRTDNLLGPKHALAGVVSEAGILDELLHTTRNQQRDQALRLAAQYAESAAWLTEDLGDLASSRRWTGQALELAVAAGDDPMVAWTLLRRSHQAESPRSPTGLVYPAEVIGLAESALRHDRLTGRMRASILQQQARGHALDGDETTCHNLIDQAHAVAAEPDDRGDARSGHGSFCTAAYLEAQRGACWVMLGRPDKAAVTLEAAIAGTPAVYRRDLGVAQASLATAYAGLGEVDRAAVVALDAWTVAEGTGSARIADMIQTVSESLRPHSAVHQVAALRAAVAASNAL